MTPPHQLLFEGRHLLRYAAGDNFSLPEPEFPVCRFRPIDALCLPDFGAGASDRFKDGAAMRMRLSKSWEERYWHASS
jgi:hypothetical protein